MKLVHWMQLLLIGYLWGLGFIFVELLLVDFHPFIVSFLTIFFGALSLIIICAIQGQKLPRKLSDYLALFVMGIIADAFPFTLTVLAQTKITASLASILDSNTALWTVLVAPLVFDDEKLEVKKLVGVLVGIVGVILAVGKENLHLDKLMTIGPMLVVIASFSYAFAGIWAKRFLLHLPDTVAACGMLVNASLIYMLVLPFYGDLNVDAFSPLLHMHNIVLVVLSAVLACAIPYILIFSLINNVGVSNASLVAISIPLMTIFSDMIILQQIPEIREIFGFVVIVLALLIIDGRLFRKLSLYTKHH